MSLDAARLAAIRERLDKATPGPWRLMDERQSQYENDRGIYVMVGPEGASKEHAIACVLPWMHSEDGDAALIADAPTDLADLLAAHEALAAQGKDIASKWAAERDRWHDEAAAIRQDQERVMNQRDALTAQVAALHEAIRHVVDDEKNAQGWGPDVTSLGVLTDALANTAAAAEAFKRQQRLEGARRLLADAEELLGGPHGETYFASVQVALTDMEREASA